MIQFLDKTTDLTPSSIDSNDSSLAVSYLNGTVKIFDTSSYNLALEKTFYYGNLHQLKWNPLESHFVIKPNVKLFLFQYELCLFSVITRSSKSFEHLRYSTSNRRSKSIEYWQRTSR